MSNSNTPRYQPYNHPSTSTSTTSSSNHFAHVGRRSVLRASTANAPKPPPLFSAAHPATADQEASTLTTDELPLPSFHLQSQIQTHHPLEQELSSLLQPQSQRQYTDLALKSLLATTQREHATAQDAVQKTIRSLEASNASLQSILDAANAKIAGLEQHRAFLLNLDQQQKEALNTKTADWDARTKQDKAKIAKLESDLSQVKEKLSVTEERLNDVVRKRDFDIGNSTREVSKFKQKAEALDQELQRSNAAKSLALKQLGQLQMKTSELETQLSIAKHDGGSSSARDSDTIKKQLNEQSAYIHSLETSNSHLKSEAQRLRSILQSTTKQEEKIRTLELQLSSMDNLRTRLVEAEAESTTLKAEKNRWVSLLKETPDLITSTANISNLNAVTPLALVRALANERLERAREKEKLGEELGELKVLREKERELEIELEQVKNASGEIEAKSENLLKQVTRLEKGRELSMKETVFLRDQLTTVHFQEHEVEGVPATTLISDLQSLLEEYKQHMLNLEKELANQTSSSASRSDLRSNIVPALKALEDKVKDLENEIGRLKTENTLLQKEVENFDNQIFVLERAIGQGAFDRKNLKVLQLAENPESKAFAIRKELLDTLQAENKALKERLSGSEYGALVPAEVVKSFELEGRRLLGVIEERDKRIARLREVFTEKSQEFKEAVFSLLGYKVEFQESRVRLISTYADPHDSSSFLFTSQENDNGTMQIVGGSPDRVAELNELRERYVLQYGSVPAFLASVTLNGWNRTFGVEDMQQ
ncbi:UNVERIFIED_CONTAM: coiled-coil domain-containing protein mad1 [Siphonaria sp. JEL0065]|nr:coiled-coil domain-containing protein mad1 [Siphonaria sp. JEL0065]